MKDETKRKWRARWERVKAEAPAYACGGIIGAAIFGYVNSLCNSYRLDKVEKRVKKHSELINQHADAGNALVERCKETDEKVEELQRKQELLMENALRITEGRR